MTLVTRVAETGRFITDRGLFLEDKIQNIFLKLCFEKHSDATYIYMIKRDMGIVFSELKEKIYLYCLSIGVPGFGLLELNFPFQFSNMSRR